MLEIRAEENRLLAAPSLASERVMLRYFPGARWVPARGAFSLPRQTGVYRLLDELFGPENWRAPSDLSEEVQEARKAGGSPTAEARLEDAESEFSVQCAFADKELVKRVPGYRWVPTERRWRLPRVPLTVRVLQRVFGEQLKIEDEERVLAWCTEEEQRTDAERRLAEREDAAAAGSGPGATGLAAVPAPEAEGEAASSAPVLAEAARAAGPIDGAALFERLERLTAALERLVEALESGQVSTGPGTNGDRDRTGGNGETETGNVPQGGGFDWRAELERLRSEHDDPARLALAGRLENAEADERATLMALLGVWHFYNKQHDEALRMLRRAFAAERDGRMDPDLDAEAVRVFQKCGWQVLNRALGQDGDRLAEAYAALLSEVQRQGSGVPEAAFREGLGALTELAEDAQAARREPNLHGLARLAQFVGKQRIGDHVDEERLGEFVRDGQVAADIRALGLVLLANVLYRADDMSGWQMQWPVDPRIAGDFAWATETALELIPQAAQAHQEVASAAAVAALAIIARGPREWATRDQRRRLLRLIESDNQLRRYAEFLAAFRLAADGDGRGLDREFKGYFDYLAKVQLDDSWEHLSEVLANDSGHVTDKIIDEVLPAALEARGIRDLRALMEAVEFAAATQRGDNTLNRIADGIEEGTILGADALGGEERLRIFELALRTAQKKTHKDDADVAFQRLVREHLRQGRESEIPNLCETCFESFPYLRERAMLAAVEWAVEQEEPFEELLDRAISAFRKDSPLLKDFRDLASLPQVREAGGEKLERLLGKPAVTEVPTDALNGKSVLVVGGHPSLQAKAEPMLAELGLKVDWLDADAAKQGDRAVGSARGAVDLVVVNTGYISHAASGRVMEAAKSAGNRYVARAFAGPRMLVAVVQEALAAKPEEPTRGPKGPVRR